MTPQSAKHKSLSLLNFDQSINDVKDKLLALARLIISSWRFPSNQAAKGGSSCTHMAHLTTPRQKVVLITHNEKLH